MTAVLADHVENLAGSGWPDRSKWIWEIGGDMERITNQTIIDKAITLDDYEFIDCEFVNCILEYSGGFCILNGVRKVNCAYSFQGPAWNTIAFLQCVGLLDLERCRLEHSAHSALARPNAD